MSSDGLHTLTLTRTGQGDFPFGKEDRPRTEGSTFSGLCLNHRHSCDSGGFSGRLSSSSAALVMKSIYFVVDGMKWDNQ